MRYKRRITLAACAILAATAATSCTESPTATGDKPSPVEARPAYVPPSGQESPDVATFDADGTDGVGTSSILVASYPHTTMVSLHITGWTHYEPVLAYAATGVAPVDYQIGGGGCAGQTVHGRTALSTTGDTSYTLPSCYTPMSTTRDTTDSAAFKGSFYGMRYAAQNEYSNVCTICWIITGHSTAVATRINMDLRLTLDSAMLDDSTAALRAGAQYRIKSSPSLLNVKQWPAKAYYYIDPAAWEFTPDGGSMVMGATACNGYWDNTLSNYATCRTTLSQSGSMKLTALVNGKWKSKTVRLVIRRNFRVVVDKSTANPGDTARFTTSLDGKALKPTRWKWVPTKQRADSSLGLDDPPVSQKKAMYTSGRMWAYLTYPDNTTDSAYADVSVAVPCPTTNDSLLNDPWIRHQFVELMNASNPDSAPGAGRGSTNPALGWKKEHAAWVFRRADSTYYTVEITGAAADECHIVLPGYPTPPAGDFLVGVVHTHPASGNNNEAVYGTCKDTKGNQIQSYPGEPYKLVGHAGIDALNGGGSDADWTHTLPTVGLDVYIVNKDDEVWRLPAYTSKSDRTKNKSQRVNRWRNKQGCQDWK